MPVITSVIIPVRNGERFIREALSSALSQIEAGDEVLVVDDGSTDRTRELVEGFRDRRIRIFETGGRGVSAARNMGLAHALGEFVGFLDHDDVWPEERHRVLLSGLRDNPGFNAAYGRIHVIREPDAPALPIEAMHEKHLVSQICSGLYRRELLDRAGLFDENLRLCQDVDLSLRLSESGMRPLFCEAVSLHYRRHGTNATIDQKAVQSHMMQVIARKLARAKAGRKM